MSDERPTVHVFFDYSCPYAYVGKLRADRLAREFDIRLVWLPWEIYPARAAAGEERPDGKGGQPTVGWVADLAAELGATMTNPSRYANTNLALRGAEYAKDQGDETFAGYHAAVFDAAWQRGLNLSDTSVLAAAAEGAGMDPVVFAQAITHHAYQARLDEIERKATLLGVQRVPTFVFGDQRIVGNDAFEPSLRAPLSAFLSRWKTLGEERTTTLREDAGLESVE